MSIKWWMDKEDVVYIYNGILPGNEKEWNPAICNNMDGTGGYYAKWNKSIREKQIYDFTHMWNLRNSTNEHRGRKGKVKTEREASHKGCLNTENKLSVAGGWWWGMSSMGDGYWGGHLLGWALDVVCKWWIMGIYSQSQEHTVYTIC